ncbi:MAG: S8 family serine peptidase [Phycisphaeraceae bacterium]|nr:S8 family serine peptidase [Phycisphaeraceae bacterium]MCW5761990.1 S8 family serine peptidase [Phycisphaeraceae bacterium]
MGGAFGQFGGGPGGWGQIEPIEPYDPMFNPDWANASTNPFHRGQHWLMTTRVPHAWTMVGYDPNNPPEPNLTDPNRIIAFIDSGIDLDHIEFGGRPGTGGSRISAQSVSIFQENYPSGTQNVCNCDSAVMTPAPEDTAPLIIGATSHGTLVAGIAAAEPNGIGMVGTCWDCGILVIRVFAYSPDAPCGGGSIGTLCRQSELSIAASIRYAAGWDQSLNGGLGGYLEQPRARIISISDQSQGGFSGIGCTDNPAARPEIVAAIEEAYGQGCIIVVLAGNVNSVQPCWMTSDPVTEDPDDTQCTPLAGWIPEEIQNGIAIHPKTIVVGGTCMWGTNWLCRSRINPLRSNVYIEPCCPLQDENWCNAYYPSLPEGADPDRLPVLSVVAPMSHVFGTWGDGLWDEHTPLSNNDFGIPPAGTSFATPQVAGIVALMLRVNPNLTFEDVRHILEVTATDIEDPGYDAKTGHGLVNARAAVEYVIKMALPANFNGDESIDTLDAIDFLIAYGQGDLTADLDLDGQHTEADLAIFLDSYLTD